MRPIIFGISLNRLLGFGGFCVGLVWAGVCWGQATSQDAGYAAFKETLGKSELAALKLSLRERRPEWLVQAELESIRAAIEGSERELAQAKARVEAREPGPKYEALSKEAGQYLVRAREAYEQYQGFAKDQDRLTDRLLALQKFRPKQGAVMLTAFSNLQKRAGGLGHSILNLDGEIKRPATPPLAQVLEASDIPAARVKSLVGADRFILGCNFVDRGWVGRAREECFGPLSKGEQAGGVTALAAVALQITEELEKGGTSGLAAFGKLGDLDPAVAAHGWMICLAARAARREPAGNPPTVSDEVAGKLVAEGSGLNKILGGADGVLQAKGQVESVLLRRKGQPWKRHGLSKIEAIRTALSSVHAYWLLADLRLIELGGRAFGAALPESGSWSKSLKDFDLEMKTYMGAGMDSEGVGVDLLGQAKVLGTLVQAARDGAVGLKVWRAQPTRPARTALVPDVRVGSRADLAMLMRRIYSDEIGQAVDQWNSLDPRPDESAEQRTRRETKRQRAFDTALRLVQEAKVLSAGMPSPPIAPVQELVGKGLFKQQGPAGQESQVLLEFFVADKQTWIIELFTEGKTWLMSLTELQATEGGKRGGLWWLGHRQRLAQKQGLSFIVAPDGGLCYHAFARDVLADPVLSKKTRGIEIVPTLGFYGEKWPLFDSQYPRGRTFTGDLILDLWGRGAVIQTVPGPSFGKNLMIRGRSHWAFLHASGVDFDRATRDLLGKVSDPASLFGIQRAEGKLVDVLGVRHNR